MGQPAVVLALPVAGREVVLDAGPPAPSLDDNGLPIHGLMAADGGWQLDELRTGEAGGDVLGASLDFAARPDLMAAFPFPISSASRRR